MPEKRTSDTFTTFLKALNGLLPEKEKTQDSEARMQRAKLETIRCAREQAAAGNDASGFIRIAVLLGVDRDELLAALPTKDEHRD